MKKFWIIFASVVCLICLSLALIFGVKNCKKKSKDNTVCYINAIQEEYKQGDELVFNFVCFSKTEYKSLSFCLNEKNEQTITGTKIGKSKDHDLYKRDGGGNFIDSTYKSIDTSKLETGWYMLTFYGYDSDGVKHELTQKPYLFKISPKEA